MVLPRGKSGTKSAPRKEKSLRLVVSTGTPARCSMTVVAQLAAMKKTPSAGSRVKKHRFNKAWMHEHVTDPYVREAQAKGYRSRAAFKLLELADKDRLFRRGMSVVDLGA